MGARRFGPDIGRFLQQDVLGSALGDLGLAADPLTGNRYALAGGNPVSYIEWDGHYNIMDGGGGAATTPTPSSSSGGDGGFLRGVVEQGKEEVRSTAQFFGCSLGLCGGAAFREQWRANKRFFWDMPAEDALQLAWESGTQAIREDWKAGRKTQAAGRATTAVFSVVLGGKGATTLSRRAGQLARSGRLADETGGISLGGGGPSAKPGPWKTKWTPNEIGVWGEERLAQYLGGAGVSHPRLPIPGSDRILDRVVGRVGYESKAGKDLTRSPDFDPEIRKDQWLLEHDVLESIEWHFWRGVRPGLLAQLRAAGITPVVHPPSSPLIAQWRP